MKKYYFYIFLILGILFLISCNSNTGTLESTEEKTLESTGNDLESENTKIYEQFDNEFIEFQNKVSAYGKLVTELNAKNTTVCSSIGYIQNDNIKSTIKVDADYMESDTIENGDRTVVVYTYEDGIYYANELYNDDYLITSYATDLNYNQSSTSSLIAFKFNKKTGSASYDGEEYTFIQSYKDILEDEYEEFYNYLYTNLRVNPHDVLDTDVVSKFKFVNDELHVSNVLEINLDIYGYYYFIDSTINYVFKLDDFEKIDISNREKIFTSFESVNEYAELDEVYFEDIQVNLDEYVYKYKLDKGYYYFKNINGTERYPNEFKVYDKNRELLENNKLTNLETTFELGTVFEVEKPGDYYIKFSRCYDPVCLSEFDPDNYKEFDVVLGDEMELSIGENGYLYTSIELEEHGYLIFENNSDCSIKYIANSLFSVEEVQSNSMFIFTGNAGKNSLYLVGDTNTSDIKVKITYVRHSSDQTLEEFEVITTEPSDNLLICKTHYVDKKYKLIVTETSYYKLNCTYNGVRQKIYFRVQDENKNTIETIGNNTFYLKPGIYIVEPTSYDFDVQFVYGYVSYSIVEID